MRITSTRPANPNPNPEPQQPNPQQGGENSSKPLAQKPKKQKKQRKQSALKPEHFQTGTGLKKLYQLTNQIKWQDPMTTQSAMNLVVMTLKSWQFQMMPKYSYGYFLQRCQALGSDKLVGAYLQKVRRVHKGEDHWDQVKRENDDPNKEKQAEDKPKGNKVNINIEGSDNEGLDLANPNADNYQNYEDDQQLQKFKQRAELAKKLASTTLKDNPKGHPSNQNRSDQQEIDDLMDEDLRMFEEMSRRKDTGKGKPREAEEDEDEDGVDLGGESGVVGDDDGYYDDD